jgi:hypothetical protein
VQVAALTRWRSPMDDDDQAPDVADQLAEQLEAREWCGDMVPGLEPDHRAARAWYVAGLVERLSALEGQVGRLAVIAGLEALGIIVALVALVLR